MEGKERARERVVTVVTTIFGAVCVEKFFYNSRVRHEHRARERKRVCRAEREKFVCVRLQSRVVSVARPWLSSLTGAKSHPPRPQARFISLDDQWKARILRENEGAVFDLMQYHSNFLYVCYFDFPRARARDSSLSQSTSTDGCMHCSNLHFEAHGLHIRCSLGGLVWLVNKEEICTRHPSLSLFLSLTTRFRTHQIEPQLMIKPPNRKTHMSLSWAPTVAWLAAAATTTHSSRCGLNFSLLNTAPGTEHYKLYFTEKKR